MLATAREQVGSYPTVRFVHGQAIHAEKKGGNIAVTLDTANVLSGARLLLAFGIADVLPDVPGLAERWGKSVIHCPYCHGYEFGGQELGVFNLSPSSSHQARLVSEWGPTTFYLNGAEGNDGAVLDQLARRHVVIEPTPVKGLAGSGEELTHVLLEDVRSLGVDALYIAPRHELNSPIASKLGCRLGPVNTTASHHRLGPVNTNCVHRVFERHWGHGDHTSSV